MSNLANEISEAQQAVFDEIVAIWPEGQNYLQDLSNDPKAVAEVFRAAEELNREP